MSRSITCYLALGTILTGISSMAQADRSAAMDPALKITLHVRNYAQVESETLLRAEDVATRIYRNIGIETVWVDSPTASKGTEQEPKRRRMSEIDMNLLPRAMKNLGLKDRSLGMAPGEGPKRAWAYVFYDRVQDLFRKQVSAAVNSQVRRRATTAQILGYAMAHEVGHLLGLEAHSSRGIMRAAWRWNDLLELSYGDLVFTPEEATVVRAELRSRQQDLSGVAELPAKD